MSSPMSSLLILTLITSLFSPILSTSRHYYNNQHAKTWLQVPLKRVDSGENLKIYKLLQSAITRGRKKIQKLYSTSLPASHPSVHAPVHYGIGEYLVELSIGTPPVAYSAILDTGSDLIWTQCAPCDEDDCFEQSTPLFNPTESTSYSPLTCSSNLCTALPVTTCDESVCQYTYTYGDYSSTQGVMASETFTFAGVQVPNVGFGCGFDNEGDGFVQSSGLVGMGRGPLSLMSQLDEPVFSYCLTPINSTKTSTLLMGSKAKHCDTTKKSVKTTPLIRNPSSPAFYYISLEGITVGETRLSIPRSTFALKADGTGGMVIDSGTTITFLEHDAFYLLSEEFTNQMQLPANLTYHTDLPLCFNMPLVSEKIEVPKLVFHFEGADLELPRHNYFIEDWEEGLACLAVAGSTGMSLFGNIQQQNLLVTYDLVKETISFEPKQCDQL